MTLKDIFELNRDYLINEIVERYNGYLAPFNDINIKLLTTQESTQIIKLIETYCHTIKNCDLIVADTFASEFYIDTIDHKIINLVLDYFNTQIIATAQINGKNNVDSLFNPYNQQEPNNINNKIQSYNQMEIIVLQQELMKSNSKELKEIYSELCGIIQLIY